MHISATTHISADVKRITLNALCMTISQPGERLKSDSILNECLRILRRHSTYFTSDFLSFIDVELIRFFHGALQLHVMSWQCLVTDQCSA